MENYETVKFHDGLAITGAETGNGFKITTDTTEEFTAKKLIFATGIKDNLPDIKGFAECWGISVIHCPYCHGYEFRKQHTAILANGPKAFHLASLVNNLTDSLTILTTGKADFLPEQLIKLKNHHIKISETKIREFEHRNGQIRKVVFDNGTKMNFDAVYAAVPFSQHSDIPQTLGCELTEDGYLKVDDFQKTSIPGVYACGDTTNRMRSVANAVYSGNLTGAVVNGELTNEQFI